MADASPEEEAAALAGVDGCVLSTNPVVAFAKTADATVPDAVCNALKRIAQTGTIRLVYDLILSLSQS